MDLSKIQILIEFWDLAKFDFLDLTKLDYLDLAKFFDFLVFDRFFL